MPQRLLHVVIGLLAFACQVHASDEADDGKLRIRNAQEKNQNLDERRDHRYSPIVFSNIHEDSLNETDDDTCTYEAQDDGSILINTQHDYENYAYCHEYWECDDPNHVIFYKYNRIDIQYDYDCDKDWSRFAWAYGSKSRAIKCGSSLPKMPYPPATMRTL